MRSKHSRFATLAAATLVTTTALAGGLAPATASAGTDDGKTEAKSLVVHKTVKTSFTRTYKWTIDKKGDKEKLFLKKHRTGTVGYTVTLAPTYTDSDFKVFGKIHIKNPSDRHSAKIKAVTDVLTATGVPDVSATVRCPDDPPFRLGPGKSVKCFYFAKLPTGAERTNTATVTTESWSKVKGGSATAPVKFLEPTKTVDACVFVKDSRKGPLGEVCADDAVKAFTYTLTVGPYHHRGKFWFKNVAAFKTEDTHTVGYDKWVVKVLVFGKHKYRSGDGTY